MDWLIRVGVLILEFLFFAGVVGSALVIVLSGIEDIETIFESEETGPSSQESSGG